MLDTWSRVYQQYRRQFSSRIIKSEDPCKSNERNIRDSQRVYLAERRIAWTKEGTTHGPNAAHELNTKNRLDPPRETSVPVVWCRFDVCGVPFGSVQFHGNHDTDEPLACLSCALPSLSAPLACSLFFTHVSPLDSTTSSLTLFFFPLSSFFFSLLLFELIFSFFLSFFFFQNFFHRDVDFFFSSRIFFWVSREDVT